MIQNNSILIDNIENKYTTAINLFQCEQYNESEKLILEIIDSIPDNSDIYNFYGRLKQFLGQFDKSIELLEKSITLTEENFMAHYNLGLAYCIKKNLEKVKYHFNKYLTYNTDNSLSKYTCNLYISKLHFDELDIIETADYYKESKIPLFVELSKLLVPRIYSSLEEINESRELYYNTLYTLINSDISQLIIPTQEMFSEYLQFIYCYVFPLSYQGENNRDILKLQCELYRKIFPCLNYTSKYINSIKINNNKIKIGFISTNFFNQSVSRDRMGIIRNLPRDLFEVVVFFYFKPNDDLGNFIYDSDNTNIILPDSNIFERRRIIEEQKLNILIYCDIGMAPDTYFLSYSRLAPIQCNTWGHSDTSGVDTIDYYLSSVYYEKDINPEENYSENLVLMNSLCTYYYKIIENPTIVNKNYFGFSDVTNIYLSSQVLFKLNPAYDEVINNILINDPNGIIVFIKMNLGSYIQDILIKRLEKTLKHNMTRLHLVEWQTCERDFYKLLSIADVIIDPYPFGGCNTSFSAFSMGIPIVTMPANMINGRFTYGLYKKMDIMDLVAYDFDTYVTLANKCAMDKVWRSNMVEKIKNNIHLIFNEVDSIHTWINFCVNAVNNNFNSNPILINNDNILDNVVENNIENNNTNIENSDLNTIVENTFNTFTTIPKIIHFIYFGYTEFKFIHYFSIKTVHDYNPDYTIYLYNYEQPVNNIWFELSKQYINIVQTKPPESIYNNTLNTYAHKADIVRLEKLIKYGGFYLDIDVWTLKSFDTLLNIEESCIMGYQAKNTQFEGLCNAVIGAKPQSAFLKIWLENYKTFNNTEWDNHSVYLPLKLANKYPQLIQIKTQETFFPISWFDFNNLFKKDKTITLENSYTIHLWESHTMELILSKIDPLYFYLYNTPLTKLFKSNLTDKTKPNVLLILENQNNYNIIKQLINSLIINSYNINLCYLSDFNSNIVINNYISNITDDYDLLINKYYDNKYLENSNYVLTDCNLEIITNIVSNVPIIDINKLEIPHTLLKSHIEHELLYDSTFYDILEKQYVCEYFNNIIKIKNCFIETYDCIPFNNIKKNKFVFTIIGNLNNLYTILDVYNTLLDKYDNILLYVYSNYNVDTLENFKIIIEKYKNIVFNFNTLTYKNLNIIYNKTSCYLDLNNNSYAYNFIYFKKPVILFNTNKYITNMYCVNQINNIIDTSHLLHIMTNLYDNYETVMPQLVLNDYNNLSNMFIKLNNDLNNLLLNKNTISNKQSISNIESVTNKESNIKEIMLIGKFSTFENRMDTLYYDFLNYIKNNSDYKIVFVDSKKCIKNKPLDYYINTYCTTLEPIIYNIVYTNEDEQIISDLDNSKLTKIYEIEDCYEVDNLINNINKFKYDYVIYRYNCQQIQYIISKCNCKFVHMPHYLDINIFNTNNITNIYDNKSIDILLYGNTSNFYPFRQRLFKLIQDSGLNYYYLPHPGYNEYLKENNPNKVIKKELSALISKSKITISTCSSFNYFLKKYVEISLSGSVIAGNFPDTEENLYKDCMCLLDENDDDNTIIEKIKTILNLSKKDYFKIINDSYNISINNYSYTQGLNKFNKVINYINTNTK